MTRYSVTTPFGTFKRSTQNRTYSHVVVIESPTDAQIDAYYTAKNALYVDVDYRRRYWRAPRSQLLGWAGSLELARKVAARFPGFAVHIFDAVTGVEVVA